MTSRADAEPAPRQGGGMRALTLATVFAAGAGYLVMLVAGRTLGAADYKDFAAYWAAFFALGGVANGLMQETTRGVRAARHGGDSTAPDRSAATAPDRSAGRVRLLPAGLLMGLGLAALVLASWPAWGTLGLATHSGVAVVVLAAGILGFSLQAATAGALSGTERWGTYGVLLAVDAALRLLVAGAAWALGLSGLAFCLATVVGAVTWALLYAVSPGTRDALRSRLDVGPARFWRNTATAMFASAGTSALVTGFPLFVTATARDTDPARIVGAVILAITLTRAPLLVPLTSFQSAIIVYFVERRDRGARALAAPLGAILVVGLLGAGAAWLLGPWLLRVLFDPEFELPGAVLAGLTVASVGTAALMVTGNAALARDRHGVYNAGWWVAVVASVALLLGLPAALDVRATVALLAGPGLGALVHLAALLRPVGGPRDHPAVDAGAAAR